MVELLASVAGCVYIATSGSWKHARILVEAEKVEFIMDDFPKLAAKAAVDEPNFAALVASHGQR
jgi:hypothetical protein